MSKQVKSVKSTILRKVFRGLVLFLIVGLLGSAAYKLFFVIEKKRENHVLSKQLTKTRLTPRQIDDLEEGDFILRRGYGFFSDYISKNLNRSPYEVTHAGIVVKLDQKFFVVHALSSDVSDIDGVQINTLEDFLKTSYPDKMIVTRVKNQTVELRSQIAQKALHYLELKIPFDHFGNYEDGDALYCTELIWRILEKDLKWVQLPTVAKERKAHFYDMKAMYDTVYFDLIVNQYERN